MRTPVAAIIAVVVAGLAVPAVAGPWPTAAEPTGLVIKVTKRTPKTPADPNAAAATPATPAAPATPGGASASASSTDPLQTSPMAEVPTALNGGRRDTLEDCMAIWDKGTHMTKAEWRATCLRNMQPHRGI